LCILHKIVKIRDLKRFMQITPEILKACAQDDRKAIKQLYEHCFKLLMPMCYRYHSHEEDARASLNIGFMKILGGLESLIKEEMNFTAWSKRVMTNTLIDEYRKKKNHLSRISTKETERELDVHSDYTDNGAESIMGHEVILKLVKELPSSTGKVFNLYVIEGYSHREIGELLEMSEGTSKWHLSTARKLLREKLEQIEQQTQKMVI
jgi:RNA polymerase sigma factor (sigma-70 family)